MERAAWWGGFWERLVRSTKTCLKKILQRASLKFEELQTVLAEVEAILNSRPLTYVFSDAREAEPLTPGHFLIGRRIVSLPNRKIESISSTHESLTRRFKYKLTLVDRFWKTWRKQYLLDLRSANETKRVKFPSILKENDVVLIQDNNHSRLLWKMGVIEKLYEGRDGKVRSCTLRLSNGSVIRRPIQLLHPLELNCVKDDELQCPSGAEDVATTLQRQIEGAAYLKTND